MTDQLERRLGSAMSPPDRTGQSNGGSAHGVSASGESVGESASSESALGGSFDSKSWSRIEAAAKRRTDRSDLAQRVAMVASVFLVAGSAVALGSGGVFGSTEAGGVPGSDREVSPASDHTVWRWLFALGLTVALGNGIALLWRRIPHWYFAFRRPSSGRWRRVLGTIVILGGLALPTWAFTNFVFKYNEFMVRMQSLDEDLDTVSIHSPIAPMFWSYQPTVWLEVAPSKPDGDPLTQVRTILIQRGFKADSSNPSVLIRGNSSSDQGWTGRDDLTLSPTSAGLVLIEARASAGASGRGWLTIATVAGFTLVALGAVLAWYDTSAGSWLGALLLGVSALQAGLALRALFRVRVLFDQFDQVIDMSRSDLDFSTFQRRVEDAGGDLYPIGSASLIFLLLPWIVGSILAFESKPRARAWSISIGLAVTVATYVTFQSIDSDLNDLLN